MLEELQRMLNNGNKTEENPLPVRLVSVFKSETYSDSRCADPVVFFVCNSCLEICSKNGPGISAS